MLSTFILDGATTLIFVVNGANVVCWSSCAQQPLGTWWCRLTTRQGVQFFAGVNAALHVALERSFVYSTDSFTYEIWLEQHFHVKETFSVDSDDVSVWETSLISSWMESAPSVYSSCARQSFGKWPCHQRARHWRTDLCECKRHTS